MTPVGERTWMGQARKRCPTFSQEWREPWRNMFPCLHRELCTGIQRQRSVHKKKSAQRLEYWRIIIHVSGFQKEDETCEWGRGCTSRVDWQEGRTERGETKEERTHQTPWPGGSTHRRSDGQFSPCVQGTIGSILPPARVHHVRHRRSCPLGDSEKKFENEQVSLIFAKIWIWSVSKNAKKWVFGCKDRLRYRRKRAL